jgi:predicted metal-dependent hydrolase
MTATTQLHPKSTAATRTVTTRRFTFDHVDAVDTHYFDDDLIASHLVAALSAVIPAGERFVADTVRRYRSQLDPDLKTQANSFVGQELVHQREHDRFNQTLRRLGYPTALIDRASQVTFAVASHFPARLQVAMTAAIEHWTAVIGEHTLASDDLDTDWDLPEASRAFFAWHLVEELEHRAVAFDTMQMVGTSELERILALRLVVAMLAPAVVGGFVLSLARDRDTWRPLRLLRSVDRLLASNLGQWSFLRDLLSWSRPGFHPDERNIDALLEHWRERVFGPGGLVVGLAGGGAS